jgi:hypothetical protein
VVGAAGVAQIAQRDWRGWLVAAAAIPGPGAAVDQHAAAVREMTTVGMESSAAVAGAVLLANYARGLLDEARKNGWRPPEHTGLPWAQADWITVRLLSVCALAAAVDQRPAMPFAGSPAPFEKLPEDWGDRT